MQRFVGFIVRGVLGLFLQMKTMNGSRGWLSNRTGLSKIVSVMVVVLIRDFAIVKNVKCLLVPLVAVSIFAVNVTNTHAMT